MEKIKYEGSWSAGSSYMTHYEFTSLKDAKKTMRSIAKGNCTPTNPCKWWVENDGEIIATGIVKTHYK